MLNKLCAKLRLKLIENQLDKDRDSFSWIDMGDLTHKSMVDIIDRDLLCRIVTKGDESIMLFHENKCVNGYLYKLLGKVAFMLSGDQYHAVVNIFPSTIMGSGVDINMVEVDMIKGCVNIGEYVHVIGSLETVHIIRLNVVPIVEYITNHIDEETVKSLKPKLKVVK